MGIILRIWWECVWLSVRGLELCCQWCSVPWGGLDFRQHCTLLLRNLRLIRFFLLTSKADLGSWNVYVWFSTGLTRNGCVNFTSEHISNFRILFRDAQTPYSVTCVALGEIRWLDLAVNGASVLGVGSWGCRLSERVSAAGTVVILCSAWSQAVPQRVLVAPCKSSLSFITAHPSCACTTVPGGFWKAFVSSAW